MEKILVAGATGSLGWEVIKLLHHAGIPIRALTNDGRKKYTLQKYTKDIVIADAREPDQIIGVCKDISVLISTIGKSVSLFKNDRGSYDSIDFRANCNLLREAEKSGVERIIYISILGSDKKNPLKISQVHYSVEQIIHKKFNNYTIVKPTGFFSGLNDLLIMGKRGFIPVIGSGKHLTNSIHQADLALAITEQLFTGPKIIWIGGPKIHSRREMAEMVQHKTGAKIIHLPHLLVKGAIPPIWLFKPSIYHNLDYFRYVTTRNMVNQAYGSISYQTYLDNLDLNTLP